MRSFSIIAFFLLIAAKSSYSADIPSNVVILVFDSTSYNGIDDSLKVESVSSQIEKYRYIKLGKRQVVNPLYKIKGIKEKDKVTAMVLALLTGPLGGHRIFLGTRVIVPVFYIITLGGGVGVLPFIDLVVMGFSDDLTPFENNPKIFMWIK